MNELKFILLVILFTLTSSSKAQLPGGEFVIQIDRKTGGWTKTGPPIAGITYVYAGERTYDENTGTFIFPSALINHSLYSVNVSNDAIINNPIIGNIIDFEYDNKSKALYGMESDNTAGVTSLVSINEATGTYQKIGNSLPGSASYQGFGTFDSPNHTYIYLAPPNTLYSINVTSGTIIASPTLFLAPGESMIAFSFDGSSGILYGLLQSENVFYLVTINQATGASTRIGSGANLGGGGGSSAIDEANQQFIYLYLNSSGKYEITTFDMKTGNVMNDAILLPTPNTTDDNFFSLEYDNVQERLYSIHWEFFNTSVVTIPPTVTTTPILTNVTVDVTDAQIGQVTVRWRSPFDANTATFPRPFTYLVLRAENAAATSNFKIINPGHLIDSTYVDTNLNTLYPANFYYRVIASASNGNATDTSAIASSVQLNTTPTNKGIQLAWNATVPWSNNTSQYPMHWIYRGTNTGATKISDLTLIDSVNVSQSSQFAYLDLGQSKSTPLLETQTYCYAVMTQGTYENLPTKSPIRNFSEITCAVPADNTPPCATTLTMTGIDCSTYSACPVIGPTGQRNYSNTLSWNKPPVNLNCNPNLKGYNVYASPGVDQPFTLIPQAITDTFFVQSNLSSFAMCYKVSAITMKGIEGPLSNQFCFDNCPNYVLPNVFTPNGDKCNEVFSAYSLRNLQFLEGETGISPCESLDSAQVETWRKNCARFVAGVSFHVFDRWGKEIYNYQSGGANSIYIDWNGKDNAGNDLEAGVYYYMANVVFEVIDTEKQNGTLKGWLMLMR